MALTPPFSSPRLLLFVGVAALCGAFAASLKAAEPAPLDAQGFAAIAKRLEESVPLRPSTAAVAEWTRSARMTTWAGANAGTFRDIDTLEEAAGRAAEIKALGFNTVLVSGRHYRQCFRDEQSLRPILHGLRLAADACHAQGLRVIDHNDLCVWWSEAYPVVLAHPDWVQVDVRHGTPLRWFCPNNKEFAADALDYLRRLQRETGVDGFMSDEIGFRPESCGCRHCRAGFERDTGYRLPEDAASPTLHNPGDPLWRLWLKWRAVSLNRFQQKLIAGLSRDNPDLLWVGYCTTATSPGLAVGGTDMFSRSRMVNFPGMEGTNVTFAGANYLYADLRDRLAINRAHGRFGWSQFPTSSGAELQFAAFFSAVTGHGAWVPGGKQEETATIFNWQHWKRLTHPREVVADVAVVFSVSTRDGHEIEAALHEEEFFGWGQSLLRQGIQYEVLMDQAMTAEDLRRFRTVVVPAAASLPPVVSTALVGFARAGGTVVITGASGIWDQHGFAVATDPLREALGVAQIRAGAGPVARKGKSVAEEPQVVQATDAGRQELSLPGTAIELEHCQTYDTSYYPDAAAPLLRFADGQPALLATPCGNGRLVHFSFLPARAAFEPKLSVGQKVIRRNPAEVDRLLSAVLGGSEAALTSVSFPGAMASIFGEDNRRVVHLLNVSGIKLPANGTVLSRAAATPVYPPLPPFDITLRCAAPSRVTLFDPDGNESRPIDSSYKEGLLKIALPAQSFSRYAAVEIITK